MDKRSTKFHKAKHHLGSTSVIDAPNKSNLQSFGQSHNTNQSSGVKKTRPINPGMKKIDINTSEYPTQMRRDYIFDDYVVIAPKRNKRHFDSSTLSRHKLYETASSPRLDNQTELYSLRDNDNRWLVKSVANAFPALSSDNPQAYGSQEIIIDTPLSNIQFGELDETQLINILLSYQSRTRELLKNESMKYVLIFKNEGFLAGASLAHAHTQIFALPIVPPRFKAESAQIEAYYENKKTDPYDDIIQFEQKSKNRIVWEDDNFIAFCPYAPQWPLEIWIVSKDKVNSVVDLSTDAINSLAIPVKLTTSKLTEHEIDYNFYLHNGISKHQRFMIRITPRSLSTWGGFEVASGIIINTIPPEAAAKWYKSDS